MLVAPVTIAVVRDADTTPDALATTFASIEHATTTAAEVRVVETGDGPRHERWQAALEAATSPWFLLVDAGEELRADAFARFAVALRASDAAVVYADEQRAVAGAGPQPREILKPGFSPRWLLEGNYIGASAAFRRDAALAVGGFSADDPDTDGYDLLLRLADSGAAFDTVAVVLLNGSMIPWPPTAVGAGRAAGRRSVERSLARRGLGGDIADGDVWQRVRLHGPTPTVSVVVPTRDRLDLLRTCLTSLDATTEYPSREVIVVDNGSVEPETLQYLADLPHQVVRHPGAFNFSDLVNAGVAAATGEVLLLLNNDTYFTDPAWLQALVSEFADPSVGAVGCRLVGTDGVPQHEGMALGLGRHLAINLNLQAYCRVDEATRDIVAATAACVLIRRSVWDEIGGFDPALAVGYGDVDFCLRLRAAGHHVVYSPHSTVTHLGQASRGNDPHRYDDLLFGSRWPLHRSRDIDPFVNRRIEGFDPLWITPEAAMPAV